jgi:hypothetical protein
MYTYRCNKKITTHGIPRLQAQLHLTIKNTKGLTIFNKCTPIDVIRKLHFIYRNNYNKMMKILIIILQVFQLINHT